MPKKRKAIKEEEGMKQREEKEEEFYRGRWVNPLVREAFEYLHNPEEDTAPHPSHRVTVPPHLRSQGQHLRTLLAQVWAGRQAGR